VSLMATRKARLSFTLRRASGFLKLFLKNKRGLVGLLIIGLFAFLAIGAPLLTPYNQLGYFADERVPLSGSMAAPAWLRLLPPSLGGNPTLSENLWAVKDKSFAQENWRSPEGEWSTNVSSGAENAVNIMRESLDKPDLLVHFAREEGQEKYGNVTVSIYKEFDYPYSGPPYKGVEVLNVSVSGTLHEQMRLVRNQTWAGEGPQYYLTAKNATDVATKVKLFVVKPSGQKINIWPKANATLILNASGYAQLYDALEPVYEAIDVRLIFDSKGRYAFGCEVLLNDSFDKSQVSLDVRLSALGLDLYGTCWGILGTSSYGWDLWAELVYGSRISLYVGVISAGLAIVIGLAVGLASGYLGKVFDEIMMRFSDVLLVLPGLPLLIVLFAIMGASIENLIILNGFLGWMGFAKLIRSQVLSIKERPYIEAAKAAGAGTGHILVRHVMPNVMGLVYVTLATAVPGAIVAEAALAWLGFYDWQRMSWGRMLQEMQSARAIDKWWWVIPPGLSIAAISVAFILLGYALDEVLNPKLRVRR
jgi:peptide/nickel transport system permease protein